MNKKNINQLTDQELLLKYRQTSNRELIGILYQRYLPLLLGVCRKYMKSSAEAEDRAMEIIEQLFVKLLKHEITYFSSWLHQVARNHCLMYLRKHKREGGDNATFEDFMANDMESAEEMHLSLDAERMPAEALIHEALMILNEQQKICVQKFYLENMSYSEIADATGYDLNKVKSYIQNGKRNMRIYIERNHGEIE